MPDKQGQDAKYKPIIHHVFKIFAITKVEQSHLQIWSYMNAVSKSFIQWKSATSDVMKRWQQPLITQFFSNCQKWKDTLPCAEQHNHLFDHDKISQDLTVSSCWWILLLEGNESKRQESINTKNVMILLYLLTVKKYLSIRRPYFRNRFWGEGIIK